MNRWVYNISVLLGVAMTGVGVGLMAGIGAGLAVSGVLVVALTVFGASIAAKAPGG